MTRTRRKSARLHLAPSRSPQRPAEHKTRREPRPRLGGRASATCSNTSFVAQACANASRPSTPRSRTGGFARLYASLPASQLAAPSPLPECPRLVCEQNQPLVGEPGVEACRSPSQCCAGAQASEAGPTFPEQGLPDTERWWSKSRRRCLSRLQASATVEFP
jgi:hypothetical protein